MASIFVILERYYAYGDTSTHAIGAYTTEKAAVAECLRLRAEQKLSGYEPCDWGYEEVDVTDG